MGNSILDSVITYNGKRIWKRIDICIYKTESLCYTSETNNVNQLSSNIKEKKFLKDKFYKNGILRNEFYVWSSWIRLNTFIIWIFESLKLEGSCTYCSLIMVIFDKKMRVIIRERFFQ